MPLLAVPRWTVIPLLGVVLWLMLFWRGPVINDVAWQMWIAGRINSGAELYVDILEINPPLWFWLGALVERVASFVGLAPFQGLLVFFGLVASLSLTATLLLLDRREERFLTTAALLLFLFVTSTYALGQREQFTFLTIAPLIALAGRRAEGVAVPAGLAVGVGILASAGLLLKPYFLLVPLLLEGWLLIRRRALRLQPETAMLLACGAIYGAAILLFAPAYLTTMVPLIRSAYQGYDLSAGLLLLGPALLASILALIAVLLASGAQERRPVVTAALLSTAGFTAAALWQAKGFAYHFLPALGSALFALALAQPALTKARRPAKVMALLALLLIVGGELRAHKRGDRAAAEATRMLPRGATILMLTASGSAAWPLVQERGFTWPSRHMMHWMLPRVWLARKERRHDPQLERLGKAVVTEAAADIARTRPDTLLFDRGYDSLVPGGVIAFYESEPRFADVLKAYRRDRDVEYLAVYRRVDR
jgi:hypothetical protein